MEMMRSSNRLYLLLYYCVLYGLVVVALANPAAADTGKRSTYVDVASATLWTDPSKARPIDYPSLSNPVKMVQWTTSMSIVDKLDLSGEDRIVTGVLYGQRVVVEAQQGDWSKVTVPTQPGEFYPPGYSGWIPTAQLKTGSHLYTYHHRFSVVTTNTMTPLYRRGKKDRKIFTFNLSFNTHLPVIKGTKRWLMVDTPDGKRFIKRNRSVTPDKTPPASSQSPSTASSIAPYRSSPRDIPYPPAPAPAASPPRETASPNPVR